MPYAGSAAGFHTTELARYLQEHGTAHIIQGQKACRLAEHPKPHSLDVWLRNKFTNRADTKQAVNEVIDQLVATGLFEEGTFVCPDSGRDCKGIQLVRPKPPT